MFAADIPPATTDFLTMTSFPMGAMIATGAVDWQIFTQDATGHARLPLPGTWNHENPGHVNVRLVAQDTGVAVTAALDWQAAETKPDGTWTATLERVPAGGLYRLETHFQPDSQVAREWS